VKLRPTGAVPRWRWTRGPDRAASDSWLGALTSELSRFLRSTSARFRFGRLGRRTAISLVLVAAVVVAAASLLPIHQYRDQGKSIERAKREVIELQERREELKLQLARARDPKVVERYAREQMSLVHEGDEIFRIVVPADIINLPRAWYLPGVDFLITGTSQ